MLVGSERNYIVQGCEAGIREDRRGCLDCRPVSVETNCIATASGSARVNIGGTDVVVGVKADLGTPAPERPDAGRLQFAAEVSPCAGPAFQGRPAEVLAAGLTSLLESTYQPRGAQEQVVDLSSLCIAAAKKCWVLSVDVLILGIDGSLADASSLAVKAALSDTLVPKATLMEGESGDDPDIEVDERCSEHLGVASFPVLVTVAQVGTAGVVDLTASEEACSSAAIQVAVSESGTMIGLSKQGEAGISPDLLLVMMGQAQTCGQALSRRLEPRLQELLRAKIAAMEM